MITLQEMATISKIRALCFPNLNSQKKNRKKDEIENKQKEKKK